MWWFLAVLTALQLYYVREVLAAFALFAAGFAAIAVVAATVYMLGTSWALAAARFARRERSAVSVALNANVTQKIG